MTYEKITIITPNYNLADYLEATIQSVLQQGYPNLEYIIIDGGSTDGSLEIIQKYEAHLAYWCSEADRGLYDALQKGFEKSTGTIMGWLNSDDLLLPGALSIVNELFQQFHSVEWLTGLPTSIDRKGRIIETGLVRRWSKYHFYIGQYHWIQQESTFWRRSLWDRAGASLNTDLQLAGDFELWLRFFRYAKLYITPAVIGGFRFRGIEQLSVGKMDGYLSELNQVLTVEKERLSQNIRWHILKNRFIFFFFRLFRKIGFDVSFLERVLIAPFFGSPKVLVFHKKKQQFELRSKFPIVD